MITVIYGDKKKLQALSTDDLRSLFGSEQPVYQLWDDMHLNNFYRKEFEIIITNVTPDRKGKEKGYDAIDNLEGYMGFYQWYDVDTVEKMLSDTLEFNKAQDNDAVNHPSHYTQHPSGVECIQITEHMNFNCGNAFKYIWRADLKHDDGGLQDLQKAEYYIKREISLRLSKK